MAALHILLSPEYTLVPYTAPPLLAQPLGQTTLNLEADKKSEERLFFVHAIVIAGPIA
jgi:hypothetical protein